MVVGGHGALDVADDRLSAWLRRAAQGARRIVSICTGAFLLARAGILDGRTATTHWQYTAAMARAFPSVHVEPERIWVQDGAVYTSAGVTAGIDLALALIAADEGQEVALKVARSLVVFLQRVGGDAQLSSALAAQRVVADPVRELVVWIEGNPRADLGVDALAKRVGMSPRNFSRVFSRQIGCAPAHYVAQRRVDAVRRQQL